MTDFFYSIGYSSNLLGIIFVVNCRASTLRDIRQFPISFEWYKFFSSAIKLINFEIRFCKFSCIEPGSGH